MAELDKKFFDELTRKLTDEGKLIEAGWVGFRLAAIPDDVSVQHASDMKMAFMAGAAHLFSSIMNILDPGLDPTERDLRRITLIHDELQTFERQFRIEHTH